MVPVPDAPAAAAPTPDVVASPPAGPTDTPEEVGPPPPSQPPAAPAPDEVPSPVQPGTFSGAQFLPGVQGRGGVRGTTDIDPRDRRLRSLEGESFAGFDTASTIGVEALGSRTLARFVLSDVGGIDALVTAGLIRSSASSRATDVAALTSIAAADGGPEQPSSDAPFASVAEVMDAVGLGEPVQLGPGIGTGAGGWLELEVAGGGYVPGSVVHVVVTSVPLVLVSDVVAQDGTFRSRGRLPLDVLKRGEHRIRLVGIRDLGPAFEVRGDSVQLAPRGVEEARRFDPGSRAVVSLVGSNPDGGSHVAIRIVELDVRAPWWTLGVVLAVAIAAARRRRWVTVGPADAADRPRWRRWEFPGLVASAVPAVVLGWTSSASAVIWSGIALVTIATLVVAALPARRPC